MSSVAIPLLCVFCFVLVLLCFGVFCLFVCCFGCFGLFLMGLLFGLCIGPFPALLRLSTCRRPCMIIYNSSFCCGWTCVTTWRKPWRRWTEKAYSQRCKHIIRWIERTGVTANRWWISCVSGSRSTPKALEYCSRMMMIGKELLSGFWECPESLRCWTSLLTLGPFHLWFHTCLTTLVATRHCRCWQLKCYLVSGHACTACSMWSRGEPWFPHGAVLLYSHLGMAMSVMFVFSVLPLLYLPYQYKRWYKDITLTHCRCYTTGLPATFPLLGLFCAVCFGLFCLCVFSLVWFCFSVFVLWRNCDGILDMYRSTTSLLLRPLNKQTAIFASIN